MSADPDASAPPALSGRRLAHLAVRSTLWHTLGTYFSQMVAFASTLVLARLLAPEMFGFLSMATFWTGLLNVRAKLGLNYAAIQQPRLDGELLGTFFGLDLGGVLISGLIALGAGLVLYRTSTLPVEVMWVYGVQIAADSLSVIGNPYGIMLEKELQLSRLTLVNTLATALTYSLAIALAASGLGLPSLAAVIATPAVVNLAGAIWMARRRLPQFFGLRWRFDRQLAGRILRQGVATGLSTTAIGTIVLQYDNFLIGRLAGYQTLGFYDRAYRIASWPNLLLTIVLVRVGFLTFSRVQHDQARLTHAMRLALWAWSTAAFPLALTLLFGARDVVEVLYGPGWQTSAAFLPYITSYSAIWPFVSLVMWLLVALGRTRSILTFTVGQISLFVALTTGFTAWLGAPWGVVYGVSSAMALIFGLGCWHLFRQLPLQFYPTLGQPALAGLAAAAAALALGQWMPWQNWPGLFRLAMLGGSITACYLLTAYSLDRKEINRRLHYLWHALRGTPPESETRTA